MAVTAAIGSLVLGTVSLVKGEEARNEARSSQERSRGEQQKIQGEQKAQNAAQAAQERRTQVREERVRRARVLQSSEGTGVEGSSGEFGAIGALSTNLSSNIGSNLGRISASDRTSTYAQNSANFMSDAQNSMFDAQQADKLFSLSTSIFSASGGFGAIKGAPTGATEATRTGRLPGTS